MVCTSVLQNPVHNYTKAGKYTVSLSVTDKSGVSDMVSKGDYVLVFGSAAVNRFNNSGFESGDLAGWTAGSTTSITDIMGHSGLYGVHFGLGGSSSTSFLEQYVDLTLVDGFSFWGYGEGTTLPFSVYIDDKLVKTFHATSNTWTPVYS